MGKKIVKIDGKTFIVDSEKKEVEEVEIDEVEVKPEELKPEEVKPEEIKPEPEIPVDVEKKIKEAADEIVKGLNLGGIQKQLDDLTKAAKGEGAKPTKISELLNLEALMKKDVSQMTSREKILGFFQAMVQSNHAVLKALSEGTAADGGYLFPDEFRAEVIRDIADGNFMRGEVTVVPMRRDIMKIPTLQSRPKVTWTEENTQKSTTTASFYEATLTVKKMAAILYASDELVEDCDTLDIVSFIVGLFSEVIGEEEDRVVWAGNGTTQPTGIVTARAAGNIATRTAVGGLSFDNMIDLIYDLPGKYHANAKVWVHRHNIRDLRKLKDLNNRYYWQEPVAAGQPPTFYGYSVIEINNLPDDQIYFGDMKKAYWFGDRSKMTVKITQETETAFTHDQTAIRVVERIAGNTVLPQAIRCLNGI